MVLCWSLSKSYTNLSSRYLAIKTNKYNVFKDLLKCQRESEIQRTKGHQVQFTWLYHKFRFSLNFTVIWMYCFAWQPYFSLLPSRMDRHEILVLIKTNLSHEPDWETSWIPAGFCLEMSENSGFLKWIHINLDKIAANKPHFLHV